ncbi:MAG TPA: GDSL-type esterase/lipase family protein [Pyrinomonadaceae bacterium]|nr:GDSL-type esterase/lipase family protein [Pyrinomonadaceae bacterium]
MNREAEGSTLEPRLPLRRRLTFALTIYLGIILFLVAIEAGARLFLPRLSGLDLFVVSSQQQAQFTDREKVTIFESDPLLLWRLKPDLDRVVWDFTIVSTNSQNLRSDYLIDKKQPGTTRIVCLGDSVTFGYRVPAVWPERPTDYDRTALPYPMLIEKALQTVNHNRKIEVITMAVPGYTSHQGLAWLGRDLKSLDPDLVTVSFGWNDASLSDFPDRETIKTDWPTVTMRWLVDQSQIFAHATKKLRIWRKPEVPAVIRPAPRVSEKEYVDNMMAIADLTQKRGTPLIIIGAPYRDRVTNAPEAQLMTSYRAALKAEAKTRGIPFLEILELTEAAYPANKGWFGELIHPNHLGHRLIASELLEMLETQRLIKDLKIPTLAP